MQQIYVLLVDFQDFYGIWQKNTWILIQKYHVGCSIIDQKKNNSFK